MRQNSFRLRGAHCRAGVHMLRARQAHGSPLPQAAVTETSAISLGLWWRGGCPGACSEPLTMLRLPQLSCLGPGCPPSVPYHMQQTGTLGNHWVFLLWVAHRALPPLSGMGCVAFALMSSMIRSSENKEEHWQCSNAFITFITFTSVTRKLIARYLYSPFPFSPLPPLLLRYTCPLWRALGFVSQYLI